MCLTESHCGSDLGLLRTKAEPQADGSYAITGTKIFISAGEHDMSDNIVHIVIARMPDAPRAPRVSPCSWCPSTTSMTDGSRRAQCRALRLHREEDGHQGLGDLRDEL
jgi:alkylation response protein AidB-like acyl-CoA dehydrogenase